MEKRFPQTLLYVFWGLSGRPHTPSDINTNNTIEFSVCTHNRPKTKTALVFSKAVLFVLLIFLFFQLFCNS